MNSLRISQKFQLRSISEMSDAERSAIWSFDDAGSYYGCLVSRAADGQCAHKLLNETAYRFLEFVSRNVLPNIDDAPDVLKRTVNRLLFDGVLEIKRGDDYLSGPRAFSGDNSPEIDDSSIVGRLSCNAIAWGLRYSLVSVHNLAEKLYSYNRLAFNPAMSKAAASDPDGGLKHVGLCNSDVVRELTNFWEPLNVSHSDEFSAAWAAWHRGPHESGAALRTHEYKLYIGVPYYAIRPMIGDIIRSVGRSEARSFKIGRRLVDILRPDYQIYYFDTFEALKVAADELTDIVKNCPAQGVPFTCAINESGTLSWGVDEIPSQEPIDPTKASWRRMICQNLANAVKQVHYETGTTSREAVASVMQRVAMDGIDTFHWRYC